MEALERDDLDRARRASPEERGRQVLEMMRAGFRLKRASLRNRYPREPEDELEARFRAWLEGDGRG